MIEQIQGYFILTACFFQLFIAAVIFLEGDAKRIHRFFKKKIRFLTKVPWKTVIKVLTAAGFILFIKKLIYYFPFEGIMQSKFSIWWVDKYVLLFLYYLLVLHLIGFVLIAIGKGAIAGNIKSITGILLTILFFVLLISCAGVLENLGLQFGLEEVLYLLVFTPLLFLKMFCSGKYPGILTAFLLGIFITTTHNKLKPKITRRNAKFLILPVSMLIVLGFFSFAYFTGNPGEKFMSKVKAATRPLAVEDLLAAANSITDFEAYHVYALKTISGKIVEIGDIQWKREMFLRVIEASKTILTIKKRYELIKEIAVAIAKTGDTQWATSIANSIPYVDIKTGAVQEIRERTKKK